MMASGPPLVLHVIHQLAIGGMENGLVNLINRMPASHFRHIIACVEDYSDFRNRLARPDVDVIALRRSLTGVWGLRKQLFKLCRDLRPTIVHSRNMSGLDAIIPAFLAGVPFRIHGEHGWDVSDVHGPKWKPALLRRLHSPFVDRYAPVSNHIKRYLADEVGIAESRITQICNGVDTDRFTPPTNRTHLALPENFAGPDTVVIGTVGRIQKIKSQETLVRAFALLREIEPTIAERTRLAIIGNGPLFEDLRMLAQALGIAPYTWFPGAVTNVPEIMQSLDVFVLPSLLEGVSNTILEAMAAGLPVIATEVGGNVELVQEGRTGYFFQPGDTERLSKLLIQYVANPILRCEHASSARKSAVENFGLNSMVQKYAATYEEIIDQRKVN